MEKIINALARELNIKAKQAEATVQLLDEGNTVPFIARYRKEATGSLDEEQIRTIEERLAYLRNLEQRRQEILTAITAQEKLTPELEAAINAAEKMQALEDLYLPYRPKRRTRAQIARENGLEPLAQLIEEQGKPLLPLEQLAAMHIDEEKGIATVEDAWQGACDIVAENISDSADVRKLLRRELWNAGELVSELIIDEEKGIATVEDAWQGACDIVAENISDSADVRKLLRRELWNAGELVSELIIDEKDAPEFLQYREYSEPVRQLPPHRILAMNRGEDKKALKINLRCPDEKLIAKVAQKLKLDERSPFYTYYHDALADSYKRLLLPSLERELRNELTEKAEKQAISVFAANLRQLLLTQPISGHTVLGLDPGYRTGCKTAVIDPNGRILATTAMYITGSKHQQEQAEKQFVELMKKHHITLIAIGNGTASYETEQFTSQMLEKYGFDAAYIIVSEAGASVYSASKLAREELPDLDVSLRGAVSIARRVQDPLAELVKIEPKAIGVGQYQHDVNQKELTQTLGTVVESCVNHVGVELNTASPSLLNYVAGVSSTVAKNIIAYRDEKGAFKSRKELLKVARLGPAAFTQCAGFLRIAGAANPLDNTSVHPESYALAESIVTELGFKLSDCSSATLQESAQKANAEKLAAKLNAGVPTVTDILAALARPGRDPREDAPAPMTRKQVTKLSDLAIGSVVKGKVQNVVDFGAFVDIGLKVSGLIHKSELSVKYFRHPLDIVSVGDIVEAEIISIDEARNRIGLSLKRLQQKKK